jgi:hypothetical protein
MGAAIRNCQQEMIRFRPSARVVSGRPPASKGCAQNPADEVLFARNRNRLCLPLIVLISAAADRRRNLRPVPDSAPMCTEGVRPSRDLRSACRQQSFLNLRREPLNGMIDQGYDGVATSGWLAGAHGGGDSARRRVQSARLLLLPLRA